MRVLVDEEAVEVAVEGAEPLGRLVECVRRLAADRGRVVVDVRIAGKSLRAEQLDERLAGPCGPAGQVAFETACPRHLARQILAEVATLLADHDALRQAAIEALAAGQGARAMEHLAGCLGLFKAVQEAVAHAVRLNRINLAEVAVGQGTAEAALQELAVQLAEVKTALESHDLVLLGDLLNYEFPHITATWQAILAELARRLAD